MSTTTTSVSPSASSTCGVNLYDTPVRDAVCAMSYSDENIKYMQACCKDADIVSYYDDCGLYCQALDQTIDDLTSCLYDEGAAYQDVFCTGANNATATSDGEPLPSSTSRVIGDDDDSNDDSNNDDNSDDSNDSNNDDNSDNSDSSNDDDSAAPRSGANVFSFAIGTLLLSVMFGTL